MAKKYQLENQRFGRLLVLGRAPKRGGSNGFNVMWNCVCDCSKKVTVATAALNRGDNQSCGCLYRDSRKEIAEKGVAKYSRKAPGVASLNHVFNAYKQSARARGYPFEISLDLFKEITSGNCVYCGVSPHKTFTSETIKTNGHYYYNGIDRMDNKEGYVPGNCQPCCEICNKAKRNLSHEEFMEWISRLVKYQLHESNFGSNRPLRGGDKCGADGSVP